MKDWLAIHWVAAAGFMAGLTLLLVPALPYPAALLMVYLAGPAYMIHQIEEHAGDRFRAFVNARVFGGREALGVADVLVINLPGVWGLNLLALYAAVFYGTGWGLAAAYLILVNGLAHIGMAIRFRGYNPGLVTAVVLFFPFGLASLVLIPGTLAQHALALAIALLVHAAIIVRVKANIARQTLM